MKTKLTREELIERVRGDVITLLDDLAEEMTGVRENGPKDKEIPALVRGLDAIVERICDLSEEV